MSTPVKIHFLGAAGTVTGSKFLLETPELTLMIDCGLFQGLKELRELNWQPFPYDARKIDIILLTHGHLDHVGYLPRLVKEGFEGKILGTLPTLAITRIILADSAKIQEEEAERANEEGYSKHDPALPLYTQEDVEETFAFMQPEPRSTWIYLSENIQCRFRYNGHIIGATFIELDINGKRFVFSGDIGRVKDPLLFPPERPEKADFLFIESTYGDRLHPEEDLNTILTELVMDTIRKRGNLIIPSFAVERAQRLIYTFWKLYEKNRIPNIPVIIDSPMGMEVLDVFRSYMNWHQLSDKESKAMMNRMTLVTSYRETWEIIDNPQPKVIIAGSGMITGGRVLTYLKQLIDEDTTTVLLAGFQAEGTRGRKLQEGAETLRFFGKDYPVKARVVQVHSLSAHADKDELLWWLSAIKNKPEAIYAIHGEHSGAEALLKAVGKQFDWHGEIPTLFDIKTVVCE